MKNIITQLIKQVQFQCSIDRHRAHRAACERRRCADTAYLYKYTSCGERDATSNAPLGQEPHILSIKQDNIHHHLPALFPDTIAIANFVIVLNCHLAKGPDQLRSAQYVFFFYTYHTAKCFGLRQDNNVKGISH